MAERTATQQRAGVQRHSRASRRIWPVASARLAVRSLPDHAEVVGCCFEVRRPSPGRHLARSDSLDSMMRSRSPSHRSPGPVRSHLARTEELESSRLDLCHGLVRAGKGGRPDRLEWR